MEFEKLKLVNTVKAEVSADEFLREKGILKIGKRGLYECIYNWCWNDQVFKISQ